MKCIPDTLQYTHHVKKCVYCDIFLACQIQTHVSDTLYFLQCYVCMAIIHKGHSKATTICMHAWYIIKYKVYFSRSSYIDQKCAVSLTINPWTKNLHNMHSAFYINSIMSFLIIWINLHTRTHLLYKAMNQLFLLLLFCYCTEQPLTHAINTQNFLRMYFMLVRTHWSFKNLQH